MRFTTVNRRRFLIVVFGLFVLSIIGTLSHRSVIAASKQQEGNPNLTATAIRLTVQAALTPSPTSDAAATTAYQATFDAAIDATLTARAPTPTNTDTATRTPTAVSEDQLTAIYMETFEAAINATLTARAPTATNTTTATSTPTPIPAAVRTAVYEATLENAINDRLTALAPTAMATRTPVNILTPTAKPVITNTRTPTATNTSPPIMTRTPTASDEPSGKDGDMAMADDAVAMGGYLVTLSGGCGCHMNRDLGGLAGGNEFDTPNGTVYAPNITPDKETGIGNWSEEDIASALRVGTIGRQLLPVMRFSVLSDAEDIASALRVDTIGRQLSPVMPYMRFSVLSDQEAYAIAAYLLSLDPIPNAVTKTVLSPEPDVYISADTPPAVPPTDPVARGEELVTVTNCGGCHTPRNADGSQVEGMFLAGAPLRDEFAHNLTPDEETGIGAWSKEEIAIFLKTGTLPDGSQVASAMGQQITRRFSILTDSDAAAIAAYLKSIPAVVNAAPSQ